MNQSRPRRKAATAGVAMWSARHRWAVIGAWLLATVGLFVVSRVAGGIRTDDPIRTPNQAQTESAKAYAVFEAAGSGMPSEDVTLVVTHPTDHVTDPEFQAFVRQAISQLTALTVPQGGSAAPVFDQIQDPLTAPPQEGLVSPDGTAVRIVARITGSPDEIGRHLAPVRAALT